MFQVIYQKYFIRNQNKNRHVQLFDVRSVNPCAYAEHSHGLLSLLGPKVVSKDIPVESIEEVSKIIRRAPVIWDNIHANDYDQKRLFLGPYKGRSTELIPRLKGVLTNPNCEFEANYVAIHTLATWYKSNMNGVRKDVVMSKYEYLFAGACVELCNLHCFVLIILDFPCSLFLR